MSGISGIIYLNQKKITNEIDILNNSLLHRALDGKIDWKLPIKNVGLGHCLMKIYNSPIQEHAILTIDDCTITADSRIDNRTELFEKLAIQNQEISDSELLLSAYKYWGEDLLFHLVGDFAFAIFDARLNKLVLGRDHLGVRPLYYYYSETCFAFATEVQALLALDFVPKTINDSKSKDYFDHNHTISPYSPTTFYQFISSVLPAHVLVLDSKGSKSEKHSWNIDFEQFKHLKTEENFINEFRKRFFEAVRCRIQSPYQVASHLSGGLDSSAVVCVADELTTSYAPKIITFQSDYELPELDESAYGMEVVNQRGFKHFFVKPNEEDILGQIIQQQNRQARPEVFIIPNMQKNIAQKANKMHARIILTGRDGDTVVGYGYGYLSELLEQQDFAGFDKAVENFVRHQDRVEAAGWEEWDKPKRIKFLKNKIVRSYIADRLKKRKLSNIVKYPQFFWHFSILAISKLKRHLSLERYLNTQEKKVIPFQLPEGLNNRQKKHLSHILCTGMIEVMEALDVLGSHEQVHYLHPFTDKRLVELCLVIPQKINFSEGQNRGVVRKALKDILPQKILDRTSKIYTESYLEKVISLVEKEKNTGHSVTNEYANSLTVQKSVNPIERGKEQFNKIKRIYNDLWILASNK